MDLGAQQAGVVPLAWNGQTSTGATAPDGQYTFTVTATTSGKSVDSATALTYGQVSSVSTGANGVTLNVPNVGALSLSQVVQIF
jgi:flagellar basal-body rod modification protein FlgD